MSVESPYLFPELTLNEGLPLMAFSLKIGSFNVNIIRWVNFFYWANQLIQTTYLLQETEGHWIGSLNFICELFYIYLSLSSKKVFFNMHCWLSHTGMHKIKIFNTLVYVTYRTIKYLLSTNKC